MMRWLWHRLIPGRCGNALAERLGWSPLFPILCDGCGELFYRYGGTR